MTRHFLNLSDAGGDAVAAMLNDALDRKAARAAWPKGKADADAPLAGHVLAMVFERIPPAPVSRSTWRCASLAARR
jgi:ornithine carbamoyltransferase